jgi:hypothetical protein
LVAQANLLRSDDPGGGSAWHRLGLATVHSKCGVDLYKRGGIGNCKKNPHKKASGGQISLVG